MKNWVDRLEWKKIFALANLIFILLLVILAIYLWQEGILTSRLALENFVNGLGFWAPFGFLLIQIAQTIIPLFPATITIPMAFILFGNLQGFILNYVGIVIGSFINFFLARKYGMPLVGRLVGLDNYHRALKWVDRGKGFYVFFFLAMLTPFSPADILAYVAGISPMSLRFFALSILIGKFTTVLIYWFGTESLINLLISLLA